MARKQPKQAAPADPKAALGELITARKGVLAKHRTKPANDAKRRLAQKRLKRAQRALGKIRGQEKRAAEAAKKGGEAAAS